ncbi:putative Centrosomal protein of 120 kDa [Hypsibius exemplaris]|uniref:Centrosomal protein of 120 kDa n=1 Tax=Hypsibius exemplaris TaxID=2072580 RepID=A0A1W0WVU4_HYPEX|nr:putative Centrosomal protein of 120 kDa [Hypsibius exemplaris]
MNVKRDSPYLLVVTVLTGRNFPAKPAESLRIDVRFDGQLLSSTPVPMVEDPVFDLDMAYRLTGAQLTKHKVQRTPIKIDVMKVNRKTKRAEKIGYRILDLRMQAVEIGKPRVTWFPLLGAQALRGKPEIHLGVCVDDDVEAQESARSLKEFTRSARNKEYWIQHQPTLVNNPDGNSHYQIGPSKDSTHVYLMSIIVGYASNIGKFFDYATKSPPDNPRGEFFFHYEVMGNHITSKPFSDFESADYSPERVSLCIRSHFNLLKEYFLHQKSLKVQLCQGDGNIVASADLLFQDLFAEHLTGIDDGPVVVEKELLLHPFPGNRFGIPETLDIPAEELPVVGVCLEMSVVQQINQSDFARTQTLESFWPVAAELKQLDRPTSARSSPKKREASAAAAGDLADLHRSRSVHNIDSRKEDHSADSGYYASLPRHFSGKSEYDRSSPPPPPTASLVSRYPEKMSNGEGDKLYPEKRSESGHGGFNEDEQYYWKDSRPLPLPPVISRPEAVPTKTRVQATASTQVSPESTVLRKDNQTETDPDMRPATRPKPQTINGFGPDRFFSATSTDSFGQPLPDATHRYVCTIYLYKIKINSPNYRYTVPVYLRYQYPFFGSAAQVLTRPAVEVPPKQEVILDNNCLTQFSFGCSETQLQTAFRTAPLCIEVWKNGGGNHDELIGQAKFRWDALLRSELTVIYDKDQPVDRQMHDACLEVVDLQTDKYPKLGELQVCLTLDDYGPVDRQTVETSSIRPAPPFETKPPPGSQRDATTTSKRSPPSTYVNLEEMEKTAAFELEVWKEREEKKFKAQLKKREDDTMRNIAEEWDRRTKQQKAYVDESIKKYNDLECQLRDLILENTQKEKALSERDRRITEAERFLQAEKTKFTDELESIKTKVFEEFTKRLSLEQSAQALLKGEIKQLCCQIDDLKQKKTEQDGVIARLQEAERQKPQQEREAQAEINRLQQEKTDLQCRLTSACESKEHYKQQLSLALTEAKSAQQRAEAEKDQRMREKETENATLRLQIAQLNGNGQRASQHNSQRSVSQKASSGRSYRNDENDKGSANDDCDDEGESCDEEEEEVTPRKHRLAMQFNLPEMRNGAGKGHGPTTKKGRSEKPHHHHHLAAINGHMPSSGMMAAFSGGSSSSGSGGRGDTEGRRHSDEDDAADGDPTEQLAQAMEERNLLLRTGVYQQRDTVIVELDKKILRLEAELRISHRAAKL